MSAQRSCRTSSESAVLCRGSDSSKGAHGLRSKHAVRQQIMHVKVGPTRLCCHA